jgi:DNA-binding response OmpR family regulator
MATGHILVLEDDPAIRDLLQQMLSDEGYQVTGAGDGGEGLAHLRYEPYDLILLDLLMPDVDGAQFMAELRGLDLAAPPPVVILSATQDATGQAETLQAAGALLKPFNMEELLAMVAQHLAVPPDPTKGGYRAASS